MSTLSDKMSDMTSTVRQRFSDAKTKVNDTMAKLPTTTGRVSEHTSDWVNRMIQGRTKENVDFFREHPDKIDHRLQELDAEWDIERILEANASIVSLIGLMLGVFMSSRWLFVPALVAAFLLQHALQGWCPPMPLFRYFLFRTEKEINEERTSLKVLRGDFRDIDRGQQEQQQNEQRQTEEKASELKSA